MRAARERDKDLLLERLEPYWVDSSEGSDKVPERPSEEEAANRAAASTATWRPPWPRWWRFPWRISAARRSR